MKMKTVFKFTFGIITRKRAAVKHFFQKTKNILSRIPSECSFEIHKAVLKYNVMILAVF